MSEMAQKWIHPSMMLVAVEINTLKGVDVIKLATEIEVAEVIASKIEIA